MSTNALDQNETIAPMTAPVTRDQNVELGRSPAKIALLAGAGIMGVIILGAWAVVLFWGLQIIGAAIVSWF